MIQEPRQEMIQNLIRKALEMRAHSYAPYSGFRVGAALLTADGSIYGGCNIENAAYTPTNCAERTAFFTAIGDGKRDFAAIVIVGGSGELPDSICPPCGVCRQVMMEFCNEKEFEIILAIDEAHYECYRLTDLLPQGFGPSRLT